MKIYKAVITLLMSSIILNFVNGKDCLDPCCENNSLKQITSGKDHAFEKDNYYWDFLTQMFGYGEACICELLDNDNLKKFKWLVEDKPHLVTPCILDYAAKVRARKILGHIFTTNDLNTLELSKSKFFANKILLKEIIDNLGLRYAISRSFDHLYTSDMYMVTKIAYIMYTNYHKQWHALMNENDHYKLFEIGASITPSMLMLMIKGGHVLLEAPIDTEGTTFLEALIRDGNVQMLYTVCEDFDRDAFDKLPVEPTFEEAMDYIKSCLKQKGLLQAPYIRQRNLIAVSKADSHEL